jgi:AcrR family transcriptional regulator
MIFIHSARMPVTRGRTRTTKTPEQLRAGLLAAAAELFASRAFSDVAVADITGHAGVATGTFYRYFPSKDDLLVQLRHEVLVELLERTAAVYVNRDPDDWWGGATAMIDSTVRFWFEDRTRSLVVLRGDYGDDISRAEAALLEAHATGLRIGQRMGAVAQDIAVDAAASLIVHGAMGLVYHALIEGPGDPDALVDRITLLVRRMLETPAPNEARAKQS